MWETLEMRRVRRKGQWSGVGSVGNARGKGNGQDAGEQDKGRGRSTSAGVGMGVLGAEEGPP